MANISVPSVHEHLDSYRRPLDGKSKFSIRVSIGGKKRLYPINTNGEMELYMDRKFWVNEEDPESGKKLKNKRIRASKGNPDAKKIERILKGKIKEMEELISSLIKSNKAITHELLERQWSRKGSKTFSAWATKWYPQHASEKNHKPNSRKVFYTCLKSIKEFEAFTKPVLVSEISVDWLKQIQSWLFRERGKNQQGQVTGKGYSRNNTIRTMHLIGAMVKYATLEGELFTNAYGEFVARGNHLKNEPVMGTFLEKDELEKLHEAYLSGFLIDKIRTSTGKIKVTGQHLHDRLAMMLFAAYTGIRFGDLKRVAEGHPDVTISSDKITIKMEKTGRYVRLKIHNKLREVANLSGEGSVFNTRILNNYHMNLNLRRICKLVGINKHIQMHGLRRSFATFLLGEGARMKMVSTLVGHSSVAITERHYAKVADNSLDEVMDLFDSEVSNFTKPDVSEFVKDVYRLFQDNPNLIVSRRLSEKLEQLTSILELDQIENIQTNSPNSRLIEVA